MSTEKVNQHSGLTDSQETVIKENIEKHKVELQGMQEKLNLERKIWDAVRGLTHKELVELVYCSERVMPDKRVVFRGTGLSIITIADLDMDVAIINDIKYVVYLHQFKHWQYPKGAPELQWPHAYVGKHRIFICLYPQLSVDYPAFKVVTQQEAENAIVDAVLGREENISADAPSPFTLGWYEYWRNKEEQDKKHRSDWGRMTPHGFDTRMYMQEVQKESKLWEEALRIQKQILGAEPYNVPIPDWEVRALVYKGDYPMIKLQNGHFDVKIFEGEVFYILHGAVAEKMSMEEVDKSYSIEPGAFYFESSKRIFYFRNNGEYPKPFKNFEYQTQETVINSIMNPPIEKEEVAAFIKETAHKWKGTMHITKQGMHHIAEKQREAKQEELLNKISSLYEQLEESIIEFGEAALKERTLQNTKEGVYEKKYKFLRKLLLGSEKTKYSVYKFKKSKFDFEGTPLERFNKLMEECTFLTGKQIIEKFGAEYLLNSFGQDMFLKIYNKR